MLRLGRARLAQFLIRYSHGQWGHDKAEHLLAVARGAVDLWDGEGIDLAELGEDLAVEAEQALMLTAQIRTLDTRIARLYTTLDPQQIARTAPGVGPVLGAAITARLGDPHRFTSLAAIRSYCGLVPKVSQSGQSEHHGGITKAGDPLLRQSLWMAADMARRADPQLAATYVRLMNAGRHHDTAICHVATTLLTRLAACLRTRQDYVIRDVDGTPITKAEGRAIVKIHHQVDPAIRKKNARGRNPQRLKHRTSRVSQESQSAPTTRPAKTHPSVACRK